jgi:hypothetical protein
MFIGWCEDFFEAMWQRGIDVCRVGSEALEFKFSIAQSFFTLITSDV